MGINFTHWPYYWLNSKNLTGSDNWAVFFGADLRDISEVNRKFFIEKTNQCLEYIRKNCAGYRLIYRPHPDETSESQLLDLTSFFVQKNDQIAEIFLWENKEKIKYVFSVCSTSSVAGFNMGFNAYSFYRYIKELFKGAIRIYNDSYLGDLPDDFFIENLAAPLLENKRKLREDHQLLESFKSILVENSGPVWFTVVENRLILAIVGLAKMIKEIVPERKINLIVSNHSRWSERFLQQLQKEFDEVIVCPRHFYSLQPKKLWAAFLTSRRIKNHPLSAGSVLVGFAHHDFVENCFMSYNRKNFKIAFLPEVVWSLNFRPESVGFDPKNFTTSKAGFFYNHFFEPLLRLNRTVFKHHGKTIDKRFYFIKLQKQIEEVYDQVFLIKNSPTE